MSTKTITSNLPSIDIEGSLSSYLTQIKKFFKVVGSISHKKSPLLTMFITQ